MTTSVSDFLAKIVIGDADLERLHDAVNDSPGTYTDATGNVVANLRKRLEDVGYKVPVAFTAGLAPQDGTFTVSYNGSRYAANPASIPFTTTSVFDETQWHLIYDANVYDDYDDMVANIVSHGDGTVHSTRSEGYSYTEDTSSPFTVNSVGLVPNNVPICPKQVGASGLGTGDDTAAFQLALSLGDVTTKNGYFRITSTVVSPVDEPRTVYGSGESDILFSPTTAPNDCFTIERTDGMSASLNLIDVDAITDVAAAGVLVAAEETRTSSGTYVVGSRNFVTFRGGFARNSGSGYWTSTARMTNAGGLLFEGHTSANFGSTTAQADTSTHCIHIVNDDADFNVIRAVHWDKSYTQRFYDAILVEVVHSVESMYLGLGEMVGHFHGIRVTGLGKLGAVSTGQVHMDCITANILTGPSVTLNVLRSVGSDLRLGANGATHDNSGVNINIQGIGNYHTVSGCFIDAYTSGTDQTAIRYANNIPSVIISSNVFRDHSEGIEGTSLVRATISGNEFEDVGVPVNVPSVDAVKVNRADSLDLSGDAYTGDLDDLAGSNKTVSFIRVGSGFTNGPSGITGAGHVVQTQVWDANAAHQEFRSLAAPYVSVRRKAGGVWSSWVSVSTV